MAGEKIEFLDHTADVAIRIHAKDQIDLLETGARAVYEVLGRPELMAEESAELFPIEVQAENRDDLFHDWLTEILYYFQSQRIFFERFRFESLSPTYVKAVGEGRKIDVEKTEVRIEIKAVTYHRLKVEQTPNGWIATVIFDI